MQMDGLGSARLAYVTPSHQFPLGSVMSAARRQELLAWARRTGAYVIEDDYDSEYRFDIAPIPPLQSLDSERVIYLGTVSKTLSPTLRLGYLVVRPRSARSSARPSAWPTGTRLAWSRRPWPPSSRAVPMSATSDASAAGTAIGERRCWPPFRSRLGDRVTVVGADAGLHVVAWLNQIPRSEEDTLIVRAHAAGLGIYPVGPLYAASPTTDLPDWAGLVIGYAGLSERDIERGVRRLAAVLSETARERLS